MSIRGKFNGAVGNFNAHLVAYPDADWQGITDRFLSALGLEPTPFFDRYADVNGDGSIDIIDALLVAQYYVGLIDTFPAQPY